MMKLDDFELTSLLNKLLAANWELDIRMDTHNFFMSTQPYMAACRTTCLALCHNQKRCLKFGDTKFHGKLL